MGEEWVVVSVEPGGPAAGKLHTGDKLLSVNDANRASHFGPFTTLALHARAVYSIEVSRQGAPVRLILRSPSNTAALWREYPYLALALINLMLAIWIGSARPESTAARLSVLLFLAVARAFAADVLRHFPPQTSGLLAFSLLFIAPAWLFLGWPLTYDFALRFPAPVPQPRALRLIRVLFYSAGFLLWTVAILPVMADLLDLARRAALFPNWFPLASFDFWRPVLGESLAAAALFLVPLVLVRNYRRLADPMARRRVRWVALGFGMAVVPIAFEMAVTLTLRMLGRTAEIETVSDVLDTTAAFFSALAPITLAYAIVKHRILGIRVVIRKGVQYLLAKNVLRVILWLPLIAIAIDLLLHPREPLAEFLLNRSWWFYLLVIASASATLRYRNRLQLWVDRKFFRSAYEEEAILSELIDSMQACGTAIEVARAVSEKIGQNLHPSRVAVLYRKETGGLFTVGYPPGEPIALQFRGILNERVQNALETHRSARTFTEIAAAVQDRASASDEVLGKTLLTPVTGANGHLLGVILLGEKKSEQSYSFRDRKLLQAIATQMGLILEMLVLKDQVREEGRVRIEVLGRLDQEQIQLVLECPRCGACYTAPATRCVADGSSLGLTLPIERVVEGKYRLERRIGTGGMGAVYEASDLRLDRVVALKVMTGRLFGNHSALRRFEREARAAARLQHPNIVAIHDFGALRGGGAYLVMQRIAGRSWRAESIRTGQIPPARAAVWFDQLCQAIACAHANGVIHRDLKPENLLVSFPENGVEKITVLDFGIAKVHSFHETSDAELTSVDRILGTYGYMSPEQRAGEPVDVRSDLYSVAVIAVEMLSANRPPASGASQEWLDRALQWPEPSSASADLLNLLARCLQPVSSERLNTIPDLQRELIPILRTCPLPLAAKIVRSPGSDAETIPI